VTGEYVGDGVTGLAAVDCEEADLAGAEFVDRVALGDPDRVGRFALLGLLGAKTPCAPEKSAIYGLDSFGTPRAFPRSWKRSPS
jgi:hypothetical protein